MEIALTGALVLIFIALSAGALLLGLLIQAGGRPAVAFRLGAAVKKLLPGSLARRYERLIMLAGSPRDLSVEGLLGWQVLAVLVGLASIVVLAAGFAWPVLRSRLVLLLVIALCFLAPYLWLIHISTERQKQIRRDLPDTLDLLTINVEAGLSFDVAVSRLVSNLRGPLVEEFSRMLREMQLGRSRGEALRALMERTNVGELNSFVLAIVEADIFGISIGQTLRSQSRDMRIRRRQNAERMAMKTPVKIIFPLVLFIFPALLIVVVGPAGIRIVTILGSR